MSISPSQLDGYRLFHEGAKELSRVEATGIRIDVDRLKSTKKELKERIRSSKEELGKTDLWKTWKKRYGENANITSRDQLGVVLFDVMGFESAGQTEGGKRAVDEEVLSGVDHPAIKPLLRLMKIDKAYGTYLVGIERELVGERIHPSYNLNKARTYRSSCEAPNFQNQPTRDKEIAEIIRRLFIPSLGCCFGENDFKGVEVSVSACYHKDPNFISYITTPGKDMHRDMAAQLYCLDPKKVSKEARYGAKNKFVFPEFYGDFYISCAKNLWAWIDQGKLDNGEGVPLKEHLRKKGIKSLGLCDPKVPAEEGTFEKHVQDVEKDFWESRFKGYGKWRKDWWNSYSQKGYFDLLSGFRIAGSYSRKNSTNYPIQGSAFHCLLWSLIEISRSLRKYRMKTRITGQIHDSLIGDIHETELADYWSMVEEITTQKILKHFPWLVVPLEIEYELAPPGRSWFEKKEVKFKQGWFNHPTNPKAKTKDQAKFLRALASLT